MKGDISCHTSNEKFREGFDNIEWDGALVDNAGSFTLEKDFSGELKKETVDQDKNSFKIP